MVDFYIALMAPRFLRGQNLDDLEEALADD